jgi:TetR/AcrR family transcriptional repressor of nem operon
MVDEALRDMLARLKDTLFEGVGATSEPLQTVLRRYLSRTHRDHPVEGCPLPSVVSSLSTGSSSHAKVIAEELDDIAQQIEDLHPYPLHPRRHRALGMFALMVGGLTLARALRGTPLSDEILIACRAYARAALNGWGR